MDSAFNIIKKIRELENRIGMLESQRLIFNLSIDGTFRVPRGDSNPVTADDGQLFYNTTTNKLMVRASGSWVAVH